ncbi:MAG: FAD-dependent oxidoreductase [Solirubrobacteraceae bacterium]
MTAPAARSEVVIAGDGVAALEGAVALSTLAGDHVRLRLLAPGHDFALRALVAHEPFGRPPARRYPLVQIANSIGAQLVNDRFAWLDRAGRTVHTGDGHELRYDMLLLALGATARSRYEHAITIGGGDQEELRQLLAEVVAGRVTRVAFVAGEGMAWPLALYEAALLSAARAAAERVELELFLITPERRPLEIFGERAGDAVASLLWRRGIELICGAVCEVPNSGHVVVTPIRRARSSRPVRGRPIEVDRVVALPELFGPHARGLPMTDNGFIPIDRYCQVRGVRGVYAAGDATDFPVKHGGIAAQQADVAAESIAALAGARIRRQPFHPRLDGLLVTGAEPYHLAARLTGGQPFGSEPLTVPPADSPKVAAKHLIAHLERIGS